MRHLEVMGVSQPLKIAEIVPLWRRLVPEAFGRQTPLFPGSFAGRPGALRNKNNLLRFSIDNRRRCSISSSSDTNREKNTEKEIQFTFVLVTKCNLGTRGSYN